jgi:hypothetical protein
VIHVGDGKYIVMEEGALDPPPRRTGPKHPTHPRSGPRFKGKRKTPLGAYTILPGWLAWRGRARSEIIRTSPPGKVGKPKGHSDGFRVPELKAIREAIVNILMHDEELNKLLDSINETDPLAAFAMREMIKLAAQPGATRDRVGLLKTILEFTKSKPATKTEMKVAQQDAWAMLIAEETTTTVPALPHDDK